MDVDEEQVELEVTPAPDEQVHLELVAQFSPFPFTHDTRTAIFARRSFMFDELVFDLLLEQASIAVPHALFPPDSPETLLDLLTAIAKCPWDALKKSCLLFYLLSFISPEIAAEHAAVWALPAQFVHLAHACFLLDLGTPDALAHAVSLLADARIVQDLSSKILHTLSLAPQPASSRLVRTYVRTAQPVLVSYDDLAIYLRALLECSLADAWTFQRTFSESTPLRNQLFRTILDGCLIPPKPSVLPHLLSLPLTTFEFSLLHAYALSPPSDLTPAAHSILQDLLTVRLLHSGKYSDAIRLSRAFDALSTKSRSPTTNATASPYLHKAATNRQQMMQDVLAVVPAVQRRQLELEFNDEQAEGDPAAPPLGGSWSTVDTDASMSWENLAASSGPKAKDRSRSGRLEGSPAPNFPGKPNNAPNTPFGLFTSPAGSGSAQKRKISAHVPTNIFGTPTSTPQGVRPAPPSVLPTIPTPGLDASVAARAGASALSPAFFRPPQRIGLGGNAVIPGLEGNNVTPTRRQQLVIGQASAPRAGTSLSFFGGQAQAQGKTPGVTDNVFLTPRMRRAGGDGGEDARERQADPDLNRMQEDEGGQRHENGDVNGREQDATGDMMMVDSDDPDGFVVRGRRRAGVRPAIAQTRAENVNGNVNGDTHANGVGGDGDGGTAGGGGTFFGRRRQRQAAAPSPGPSPGLDPGRVRPSSSSHGRILPGGFASFEINEGGAVPSGPSAPTDVDADADADARPPAPPPVRPSQPVPREHQQPSSVPVPAPPPSRTNPSRTSRIRTSRSRTRRTVGSKKTAPQTLRIPGALFEEEDDAEDEAGAAAGVGTADSGEDRDHVPSFPSPPPVPSKAAAGRRGTTTRASRASSAAEESGDDDGNTSRSRSAPRRSSRLSSEKVSPSQLENQAVPKRGGRAPVAAADGAGTGRATRKRRNVDE